MPPPASDDPSHPNGPPAPTISAHERVVTGTRFLPDHEVIVRITRPGEDISDYLTYTTDGSGCLRAELPTSATGILHIAATDHRPDRNGACGRLWSNTCTLNLAD